MNDVDESTMPDILADFDVVETESVWLEGYIQNEACFLGVADEIRSQFRLNAQLPEIADGRTAVSVHVRLGDYVGSSNHLVCSPSYFDEAMKLMRVRFEHPIFLIFSDEPDKCEPFVGVGADIVLMPPMNERETLAMMQQCDAFIVANSTFSWWPAWLSGSPDVICPSRVLRHNDWNLFPDRWTKVPIGTQ